MHGIIKIDDDYSLESDTSSWNLVYLKQGINAKTGKPFTSKEYSYHPNIKEALKKYCDEKLKDCDSIQAIIVGIVKLHATIENLNFGGFPVSGVTRQKEKLMEQFEFAGRHTE